MSDTLRLRRFHPDDTPVLIDLFRTTIHRINSRDYTPEQVSAWAPDEVNAERWRMLADRYTIVCEIGSKIAGFAELEANGHVDRFFVHADHQRQGVGRALLVELVAEAERNGVSRLYAEVSITARPFFERSGFVILAEQVVIVRGVSMINYRMERHLTPATAREQSFGSLPTAAE